MGIQQLKLQRRTNQTAEEYWDESGATSRVFAKRNVTEAVTSMMTWDKDESGKRIPGTAQVQTTQPGIP